MGSPVDLKSLLQRVVELVMPNLRHYYRMPRKGRVVKTYASNGAYWADVQPLRNDDSDDPKEPVITRVEIPILWGGPERGVVCPPAVGTLCDVTYYDGDPDYPRISNFRWAKNQAPACEAGAFVIQQKPGVFIKITPAGNIVEATDVDWIIEAGEKAFITAPEVTVTASSLVAMDTPELRVSGNIVAGGDISDAGGSKSMAGMRSVFNSHTHQENGDGGGVTDSPGEEM
ncbi:baseplate assembly protein [Geobacter sp. SVR]|uniref:baseplate assembly protein n=1 Tax=Geobacter sp. SVR TaxID=2495594 RepID=UPI00143EF6E6|nr:baseplate assembly protein [Geobacter sp. SVR]BCS55204.1 hypothetical protein GSVR_35120 [Geobacter sp. SVR]GCF86005.1 baseplate assembly protein [Geobacter sp. SVR]